MPKFVYMYKVHTIIVAKVELRMIHHKKKPLHFAFFVPVTD